MSMSEEVSKRLKSAVRDASLRGIMSGDSVKIWDIVRDTIGKSYSDADDEEALRAIEIVENLALQEEVRVDKEG